MAKLPKARAALTGSMPGGLYLAGVIDWSTGQRFNHLTVLPHPYAFAEVTQGFLTCQ
jgi:hypothetical protein